MAVDGNPFTPTFGVTPPLMAGRGEEIEAFADGLAGGLGSPGRAILLTGPRGSGKTVTLNALEDHAREQGWAVVSETTRVGLAAELTTSVLPQMMRDLDPGTHQRRVTGGSLSAAGFGGGVTTDVYDRYPVVPRLRSAVEDLTDLLRERGGTGGFGNGPGGPGRGLLISLDEVQISAINDLREVAITVQHAFREGRDVALIMAGLPRAIHDVLNDTVITFLRRAERFVLGRISDADARRALRDPVVAAGRTIGDEALAAAVAGAGGYPFLLQLVGARMWSVDPESDEITPSAATTGVARAASRMGQLVLAPAMADLSKKDRAFLMAMSQDDGPSETAEIARRLGVTGPYAGQYRLRLLAADIIDSPDHGLVDFTIPYLREYLREPPH